MHGLQRKHLSVLPYASAPARYSARAELPYVIFGLGQFIQVIQRHHLEPEHSARIRVNLIRSGFKASDTLSWSERHLKRKGVVDTKDAMAMKCMSFPNVRL